MSTVSFSHLARVSDEQLIKGLEGLLAQERRIEAEVIAHIAEVEARRLYLERGFDSMYRYCTEGLRLSEGAAYHRIRAARAARRFPVIFEIVAEGRMCLSGIVTLSPHLTEANHERLLEAASTCSKREIEELVATLFPKPAAPAYVERVAEELELPLEDVAEAPRAPAAGARRSPRSPTPRASVEPLRAERYKVQFTADRELREQIDELQALLRHQIPDGDLAEIFRRAISCLLKETRKNRFAETERPRKANQPEARQPATEKPSRHIPAAIKREVYERDGGACTYQSPEGRRCASRTFLEYHHTKPWALHGRHRAEEITLRCRAHNDLAARQEFGERHMQRFRTVPGNSSPPGRSPARAAFQQSPGTVPPS